MEDAEVYCLMLDKYLIDLTIAIASVLSFSLVTIQ